MNILVIGSGGREHSLAECFAKSKKVAKVYVSPGNAGIAKYYECVKLPKQEDICNFCRQNTIDLVFIGPEQPIAEGLSDYLWGKGISVIAPSKFAGQLETSKIFAKDLMQKSKIPTARYQIARTVEQALELIENFGYPAVIKADGLAGGKGVIIVSDLNEAEDALNKITISAKFRARLKRGLVSC